MKLEVKDGEGEGGIKWMKLEVGCGGRVLVRKRRVVDLRVLVNKMIG